MKLTDNFKAFVGEKILKGHAKNMTRKPAFCNIHECQTYWNYLQCYRICQL